MSAHTPGPWEIERRPIESRGGSNTCWRIGPFHACIYDDWRPREAGISEAENEANAHLMAAAPELADALVDAVEELERLRRIHLPRYEGKVGEPEPEIIAAARAALAKAGRLP